MTNDSIAQKIEDVNIIIDLSKMRIEELVKERFGRHEHIEKVDYWISQHKNTLYEAELLRSKLMLKAIGEV